jgi:hypothetical protein
LETGRVRLALSPPAGLGLVISFPPGLAPVKRQEVQGRVAPFTERLVALLREHAAHPSIPSKPAEPPDFELEAWLLKNGMEAPSEDWYRKRFARYLAALGES